MNKNDLKKLRHQAERITLSPQQRQRITERCLSAKGSLENEAAPDSETYVFHAEHISSRPLLRIFSTAAACAVLLGGIGTAVHLISRSTPTAPQSSQPEDIEDAADIADIPEDTAIAATVPDLADMDIEFAKDQLRQLGINYELRLAESADVPENNVIGQDTPPGTEVYQGYSIILTVSSGAVGSDYPFASFAANTYDEYVVCGGSLNEEQSAALDEYFSSIPWNEQEMPFDENYNSGPLIFSFACGEFSGSPTQITITSKVPGIVQVNNGDTHYYAVDHADFLSNVGRILSGREVASGAAVPMANDYSGSPVYFSSNKLTGGEWTELPEDSTVFLALSLIDSLWITISPDEADLYETEYDPGATGFMSYGIEYTVNNELYILRISDRNTASLQSESTGEMTCYRINSVIMEHTILSSLPENVDPYPVFGSFFKSGGAVSGGKVITEPETLLRIDQLFHGYNWADYSSLPDGEEYTASDISADIETTDGKYRVTLYSDGSAAVSTPDGTMFYPCLDGDQDWLSESLNNIIN
ncbi:MAG: PASTA domain-containing protein [Ruminococcus sp.]|nr:PASTA domain-containing protein [Ruminococcus sp.]